jgi:hypothetical protein
MLPSATNPETEIAWHNATKHRNYSEISKRKNQSNYFPRARTRIQASDNGVISRRTAKKSERPALVPGQTLGVLYSGLHGTVWPITQVRTSGASLPLEPAQIGRRHSCAKRPARQRASRDKSGHLRYLGLKHELKRAKAAPEPRFAK